MNRRPEREVAPAVPVAPRRRFMGFLVAVLVLAVVAVPAAFCAWAAVVSFVGGGLYGNSDAPSEVAVGLLWAACALVLLALPVLAGLVTARVSLRRESRARNAWWAAGAVAVLAAAVAYLSRVV